MAKYRYHPLATVFPSFIVAVSAVIRDIMEGLSHETLETPALAPSHFAHFPTISA